MNLFFIVTPEKIFYKEYLVYDGIGMFGSIGGSLGLCVGFSIFDTLCMFVDFVWKKFKALMQVLYICVGFGHLIYLKRDLPPAEKTVLTADFLPKPFLSNFVSLP